jgi:hypothetical protein
MGTYKRWIKAVRQALIERVVISPERDAQRKPVKFGTGVATPAVGTPTPLVQQWMCDAVLNPVNPLKLASIVRLFKTSSMVTLVEQVPRGYSEEIQQGRSTELGIENMRMIC